MTQEERTKEIDKLMMDVSRLSGKIEELSNVITLRLMRINKLMER